IEVINKIPKELFYKDIDWARYFVKNKLALELSIKLTRYKPLINFFPNISGAATVNEAYRLKPILREADLPVVHAKKFINTGTIDPYVSLWGHKKANYIKSSYQKPIVTDSDLSEFRLNRFNQACSEKIIIGGMTKKLECFYDTGEYIAGKSTTIILPGTKSLKFLIAVLNSKLISFWYRIFFKSLSLAGGYIRISNNEIKKIPLVDLASSQQTRFIELVNQILLLTHSEGYFANLAKITEVKKLQYEIDQLVYQLYELTPAEIRLVEEFDGDA
ncbi:MAG TPA: TaqI-like C-terminal specificity domain-containing protein, partial [Candidatus Deferrimicrobium sp.]|nr:TaqI-like C-terminal specificity domain-containing protein [Candidatus Deferrimicrobium sp.]